MSNRTLACALGGAAFMLLGFFVTYQLNQRVAPPVNSAAPGSRSTPAVPNAADNPPAPDSTAAPATRPASGELLTEDDIPALPAAIQDLLADPGWNQPYITPSFADAAAATSGAGTARPAGPYAVNLLVDAPLSAEKTNYEVVSQQDESGSYVDVALHAQLAPNSAGRYPEVKACVWAFRDGTIQYFEGGGEAQMLNTTHRYGVSEEYNKMFIVRLLVVDSDGGRSYADSLPIKIGAE